MTDLKENQYATKDPYMVALMRCLGAKIVKRIADDPKNIIAILEHDNIQAMHDAIYAGDYTEFPEIAKLEKFKQFHKEFMDYIRDIRTNTNRGR